MQTNKRYTIDMCNGPLWSAILRFSLPLVLASLLQMGFNAADIVVVGKFVNATAQGAVTSTGSLVNLTVCMFLGLSAGINVIVARVLGEKNEERVSSVVHTSIALALIGGVILTVVGEIMAPIILRWVGSPPEVIGLSTLYLRVYFFGMPGELLYNFGSALLRSRGDTKRPLYFLTIAGVLNVLLNLLFVVGLHWDVAGVAAATAASKYMSAFLVLSCLKAETGSMHLDWHQLRVDWAVFRDVARIGLPAGLQSSMFSLSNVILQSAVNSLGAMAVAGIGAASSIGGFVYITGNAFCSAAVTFTSQNFGAGKFDRIKRAHLWCMFYGFLFPFVLGGLGWLFREQVLLIYINAEETEALMWGSLRISCVLIFYFLCGLMEVNAGTLRGLGFSMLPMLVTMVGTCFLRVFWVMFVFPLNPTLVTLSLCLPLSWGITALAHLCCYLGLRKRTFAKRAAVLAQSCKIGR